MDLIEVEDLSTGCGGKNCGLAPGFLEDCSNQDCYWEEPMFGLIELVCVTVVYVPLMIFGLLGNILTILVVWLRPHMRSCTYLYLSSMAISDLLILLLLPLDLYKLWRPRPWPLGDLACKLTMFLSECCTFCTILHITFLSLERYLAVCWPITAKTVVTRRRTRAIIGCLWLGAAVSAAPVLVMVGVEDVGGEELGLSHWREDGGWAAREGEQGGLMMGGGERGGEHMALLDPVLEGKMLREKKTKTKNEEFGEFKWFENKEESEQKGDERRIDQSENKEEKEADEEEGEMEFKGEQQNKKKEDEGGGRQGNAYGSREGEVDRRECRCTHYAISSGLLSAMMILSNLYFLIPLCILGLVYSLIGRTLWLRPKSSRRDQSHRNTVKMLGVIVLAFVLCWLPFHVGRTIFSLSLGTGAERQETYTDVNSNLDIGSLDDASFDSRDIDVDSVSQPFIHSESDAHGFESLPRIGKRTARTPAGTDKNKNMCAETEEKINTQSNEMATDELNSQDVTQTELKHMNADTSTQNLHPETNKHVEAHNDSAHGNLQQGIFLKSTNTTTHGPSTYTAATDLYPDITHNDTRFNDTYSYPDTHMYFLYYLSQYFNLVSSVLFYLSAAVNPLLYNLMSARYRLAVHSLIHKHSHTQAHRLRTLTTRHSTTTL